jgi:hypothetical protein
LPSKKKQRFTFHSQFGLCPFLTWSLREADTEAETALRLPPLCVPGGGRQSKNLIAVEDFQ